MAPTTTTGSPLLMVCETLPPRSPQHSTSTKNVGPSPHSCLALSKRRSVAATRKFVTLPVCVRLRAGELTTLPMTVISVAFTVLLGSAARPARCRSVTTLAAGGPPEQDLEPSVDDRPACGRAHPAA